MFLADRLIPMAFYYMYPIDYGICGDGRRQITVSYIDWREKIYAQCQYVFFIYPEKTGYKEYTYKSRTEFTVQHLTAQATGTDTNIRQRILHSIGDAIIQWFFETLDKKDCEIETVCLRETGILVSRRLVDFLRYACQLQTSVKNYLRQKCECGGDGDPCICVALCASVRYRYSPNKLCGDVVPCEPRNIR